MAAAYPIHDFLPAMLDELTGARHAEPKAREGAFLLRGGRGAGAVAGPDRPAERPVDAGTAARDACRVEPADPGLMARARAARDAVLDEATRSAGGFVLQPVSAPPVVRDRAHMLAAWREGLRGRGVSTDPAPVLDALLERLSDPQRSFHNLGRVLSELTWFDRWCDLAHDPLAVWLAIWFRYAMHEPARFDNEARSAEFARANLVRLGLDADSIREVRELVISTRDGACVTPRDAGLLADIDRARLADWPDAFDADEAMLRTESAHMTEHIYWRRRAEVLHAMIVQPQIYRTAPARDRLEAAARRNLARWLRAAAPLASPTRAGRLARGPA